MAAMWRAGRSSVGRHSAYKMMPKAAARERCSHSRNTPTRSRSVLKSPRRHLPRYRDTCAKPSSVCRRSARERRSRMSIRSFSRCRSPCSLRWLPVFSRRSRLPGIWLRAFPTGNRPRTICPDCIAYLQSMESARYAGFILVPHCLNPIFIDDLCTGKRNSSNSSARTWRRCRSNA